MWVEEHIFQARCSYTDDCAAPEHWLVQFWLVNAPLLSMQLPPSLRVLPPLLYITVLPLENIFSTTHTAKSKGYIFNNG